MFSKPGKNSPNIIPIIAAGKQDIIPPKNNFDNNEDDSLILSFL